MECGFLYNEGEIGVEINKMIYTTQGDCLEKMRDIPDGRVDMVLADPPYGTTACKWDSIIPLGPMWEQLKRIIKPNSAIVMTASQPFTTTLISSNMKMFKYCWVWEKSISSNFFNANKQPLKKHEDICIFYEKRPQYNPQKEKRDYVYQDKRVGVSKQCKQYHDTMCTAQNNRGLFHPSTIIKIRNPNNKNTHPTQKPVKLMEYLIRTYTNEGDMVLDFCMGSGTTGVAARRLNRNFIGIEKDIEYYEMAKERIAKDGLLFE